MLIALLVLLVVGPLVFLAAWTCPFAPWNKPEEERKRDGDPLENAAWEAVLANMLERPEQWVCPRPYSDNGRPYWMVNSAASFVFWVANRDYGLKGWVLDIPKAGNEGSLIGQQAKLRRPPERLRKKLWAAAEAIIEPQEMALKVDEFLPLLQGLERAAGIKPAPLDDNVFPISPNAA